ncbi:MAG: hypothetical protein GY927_09035 [bacterium]|nr:hypothetical protein [bacterium]
MKAAIVFIHGWGLNGSIWRQIIAHMPEFDTSKIELGFVGEAATGPQAIPDNAMIVAHSLGVLWALRYLPKQPTGFISICGFDRFSPPVPRGDLLIMKRGVKKNSMAQMSHFWRSCAIAPFAEAEQLNQSALIEGLDWLMNWDGREGRQGLRCPVHVLAAANDEIVSKRMSCNIWGEEKIIWSPSGGHALPLTRPKWCADQIRQFIEDNE